MESMTVFYVSLSKVSSRERFKGEANKTYPNSPRRCQMESMIVDEAFQKYVVISEIPKKRWGFETGSDFIAYGHLSCSFAGCGRR